MDITASPVKSTNVRNLEKSKASTEVICCESCLQNNCRDMLNLKLKFIGKEEHNIVVGRCFRHGQRGCIAYKGLDTDTGNFVAVIKWVLPLSNNNLTDKRELFQKSRSNYLKQIKAIEQEFQNLRLMNFNNLVRYLGVQHSLKKDKIIIYVLQEFVCGVSLQQIFQNIPTTLPCVQMYAKKILEALHYLHKNEIVHQNLRLSSVFIDSLGSVKLSDYCLDKKLHALSNSLPKDVNNSLSSTKSNSKDDIYNYGILILTLFIGPLKNEHPIIIPDNINPVLKDFLQKCFISDAKLRWSAEQLLHHPFLTNHASNTDLLKDKVGNEDKPDYLENSLRSYSNHSRLTTEFDILKSLGKGGFGHVWKVQNKLDSRVYALKRIPLDANNKQLNNKIKREVTLLSRLSHENIVRYYNSWIETIPDMQCVQNNAISVSEKCKTGSKQSFSQSNSSVCWDIQNSQLSYDGEDFDYNDDSVIFLEEKGCDEESSTISYTVESIASNVQSMALNKESFIRMRHYMYIQMEFCENSTLRTAIDTGLYSDIPRLWRLFKEIIEGLHYIHQQGVIHRDLKPVNIFLDSSDRVKIGDFGLATDIISKAVGPETTLKELKNESCSNACYVSQTGEVGTAFYVAPELACSDKVPYDQKVDIYSLGIILFEMCFPPPVTFMERNVILTDLRKKDIILPDKAYELLSDDMIHLIIWLLQHDVTKRPTSAELIASKYISTLSMAESESIILYSSFIAITSGVNEEPHKT